ncbi:MAG: helix-turn-helix transcriptional regulator [Clostridiales bacterium]|nr:helix-turn-helix transcriptional regulator [Clostridiales bacterium]
MRLRIKEFREELQLTQKELAEKIGNVQRNVSNWENGTSEPDCETIFKLSQVFDVSIDELFGKEYSITERQPLAGIEYAILKSVRKLSETQKFSLMQFLKEMEG